MEITGRPSPNFSGREGFSVIATVMHYTADGPGWDPVAWLRSRLALASAHYVISRQGEVDQLVELYDKAWHAGASEMAYEGEMTGDVNRFTVGIELQNAGLVQKIDGEFFWELNGELRPWAGEYPVQARLKFDNRNSIAGWWEPYPECQLRALDELLLHIAGQGYPEAAANLVGHEEIAMPFGVRKMDPGPLFPWNRYPHPAPRRTL